MNGIIPTWLTMHVGRVALKRFGNSQTFSSPEISRSISQVFRQIRIGKIGPREELFDVKELVPLAKLSPDDPTTIEAFDLSWGAHAPRVFRLARSRAGVRRRKSDSFDSVHVADVFREGAEHRTR